MRNMLRTSGTVSERKENEGCPHPPLHGRNILSIHEEQSDGKEQDEEASQSHHDAEGPEVDPYRWHDIVLVLNIAIAKILHVFVDC